MWLTFLGSSNLQKEDAEYVVECLKQAGYREMDVADFLIDEEATMLNAMEQLDKVAKKVLFVIKGGRFVATVTDGDIRRWILKKGNLDAKVREIANYSPKFLYEEEKNRAKEYMKKYSVEALPILDKECNIVSVVLWNDEQIGPKKNLDIPVVIMAGGLGTRLYPYTKILPKPLIPIGEIPIAEHIMTGLTNLDAGSFISF